MVEFRRLDEWEEIRYSEEYLYALDLLWEQGNGEVLLISYIIDTGTIELIDEPSRIRWAGLAPACSRRAVAYMNKQEHVLTGTKHYTPSPNQSLTMLNHC